MSITQTIHHPNQWIVSRKPVESQLTADSAKSASVFFTEGRLRVQLLTSGISPPSL
jgi:hypothetical protein